MTVTPEVWNLVVAAVGAAVAAVLHRFGVPNPLKPEPAPNAPSVDVPLKDALDWMLNTKAGRHKPDDLDYAVLGQMKPLIDELLAAKK
jgi:hypothetical protein